MGYRGFSTKNLKREFIWPEKTQDNFNVSNSTLLYKKVAFI